MQEVTLLIAQNALKKRNRKFSRKQRNWTIITAFLQSWSDRLPLFDRHLVSLNHWNLSTSHAFAAAAGECSSYVVSSSGLARSEPNERQTEALTDLPLRIDIHLLHSRVARFTASAHYVTGPGSVQRLLPSPVHKTPAHVRQRRTPISAINHQGPAG